MRNLTKKWSKKWNCATTTTRVSFGREVKGPIRIQENCSNQSQAVLFDFGQSRGELTTAAAFTREQRFTRKVKHSKSETF